MPPRSRALRFLVPSKTFESDRDFASLSVTAHVAAALLVLGLLTQGQARPCLASSPLALGLVWLRSLPNANAAYTPTNC